MAGISALSKSKMILKIASELGVDFPMLMQKYQGEYFEGSSIHKIDFFREIFEDNLSQASRDFLTEKCDTGYAKDMRSSVEYGKELAIGWIMEDVIFVALQSMGVSIQMQGFDMGREYLEWEKISSRSDYSIITESGVRSMELIVSWGNYWQNTNTLDLRKTKFISMSRKLEGTIVLGIDASTLNGFCFYMNDVKDKFVLRPNPAWGDKDAYSLDGVVEYMKSIKDTVESIRVL
jgi:hypothetical protein